MGGGNLGAGLGFTKIRSQIRKMSQLVGLGGVWGSGMGEDVTSVSTAMRIYMRVWVGVGVGAR